MKRLAQKSTAASVPVKKKGNKGRAISEDIVLPIEGYSC